MAGTASTRRRWAAVAVAVVVAVTVLLDAPPATAAPVRTVSSTSTLTQELAAPAGTPEVVVLGADLTSSPAAAATTAGSSDLTVDLAGHDLALGSLALGSGAALRITDSTALGGTLTVDGATVDTPVQVRAGTRFTVDGTAHLRASGGRSSAVIGGHASPDSYGAGAISVLGHAVVDVQGSTSPGRTSSGIGGPQTSIHIGDHAVVRVVATSSGAALGGGSGGTGGDSAVLIDGDADVTATTLGAGAAIGSSAGIASARVTTVAVRDRARVTAIGGRYAPGIGNGAASGTSTILTVNGTASVTATGGASAAGIGGGLGTGTVGGDGADVTIGAGATVTAAGGSAADSAIGSGTGRAAASFGSLTTAGRLTIPAGSALRIPSGTTVLNSGTITTAGPVSGPGTIRNTGTIATVGTGGAVDPSTGVTSDRWALAFDAGAGTPTGPTGLRLAADSIAAGGTASSLPTPAAGQVVLGWSTSVDGTGRPVDDSTDLRTIAAADPSGAAVPLVLHAVLVPLASAVPLLPTQDPSRATTVTPYRADLAVTSGVRPVTYRVTGGALPAGLGLDPATGVLTGTVPVPQTAAVTITATNRFGTDAHEYLLTVAAPEAPPPAAPSAPPSPATPVATIPVPDPPASPPSPSPSPTAEPRLPATLGRAHLPVGAAVERVIGVAGGGADYAVTAGSLPAGLRIDRDRAVIAGSPRRPGRYRFTVTARTSAGSVERTYAMTVVAPLAIRLAPTGGSRSLPLVAGARVRVALRGLLPGERYAIRWAGAVVARGTAHSSRTVRAVRVPDRAGGRTLRVVAADHAGADARCTVDAVRSGAVLVVLAPDGVQANRTLSVRIHGLAAGEPVRVRYEGRTVSDEGARADRHGRYRVETSAGWSWGWKRIEVLGLPGRTGTTRVAVLPRRD